MHLEIKQIAPQGLAMNCFLKRGGLWFAQLSSLPASPKYLFGTYPVKRNAVLLQNRGRNEGHLVTEESVASLRASRKKSCGDITKRTISSGVLYPIII